MNPINSVKNFLSTIKNGRILVALSGGADSVCLLLALQECGADICAFHLNHGIRGEEAERDQLFCKNLCFEKGIPFSTLTFDVPEYAVKNGLGLEEAARKIRYEQLNTEAERTSALYIATAHNADDNAETVLFNLARGCSADGLSGIPQIRDNIIRPLLSSTREEIERFLEERNADFVTDSTNLSDDYSRNRIRHSVMPVLRSINPSVAESVMRLCASVEEDKAYFQDILSQNKYTLPRELPLVLLKRQIAEKFFNTTGCHLENVHITEIAQHVKNGTCLTLDLPGKNCVYISYGNYEFSKRVEISDYNVKISAGLTEISETDTKFFYGNENVYKLATSAAIDCDKIVGGLYARPRRAGDRIKVFGVSKDVRKELINKKIPLCLRRRLPVIYDEEGIVYVPYIGADDRVFSKTGQLVFGLLYSETEKSYEK